MLDILFSLFNESKKFSGGGGVPGGGKVLLLLIFIYILFKKTKVLYIFTILSYLLIWSLI